MHRRLYMRLESSNMKLLLTKTTTSWVGSRETQRRATIHLALKWKEPFSPPGHNSRLRLKCDGTRAETRFRFSPKRTSPFKSAGTSVQSTSGSRGVRICVSNAGYTTFRGSVRVLATHSIRQFPLHFPSRMSPCVITFQLDSTFSVRSRHIDQLFLINIYSPSIFCLALLETAGLRKPNRNLRLYNLFSFDLPQGALRQLIPSVGKLVDSMGSLLCFTVL